MRSLLELLVVVSIFGIVLGCGESPPSAPKAADTPKTESDPGGSAPVKSSEIIGTYKATMVAEKYMDAKEVDFQNEMLNSNGGKRLTFGKGNTFEADLSGLKISGHWALADNRINLTPEAIGGTSIRELTKNGPSRAVEAAQEQLRPFSVLEAKPDGVLKPIAPSNSSGSDKFIGAIVFKKE